MRIVEAIVNVALTVILLWPVRRSLASIFGAVPRRYLAISIASIALLIASESLTRSNTAYPLAEWDMHTVALTTDPEFIDYTIVRADGVEERLLIGRMFPVFGRKLRARIDRIARMADSTNSGSSEAQDALDAMLAAVGQRYVDGHPGVAVQSIRLWMCTIPVLHYTGPDSITRRLMQEYRLPSTS